MWIAVLPIVIIIVVLQITLQHRLLGDCYTAAPTNTRNLKYSTIRNGCGSHWTC